MEKENINKTLCRWLCSVSKVVVAFAAVVATLSLQSCVEWLVTPMDWQGFKELIAFINALN